MTTSLDERPLERSILKALTGKRVDVTRASRDRMETPGGWIWGNAADYDRELALDGEQLCAFVSATQLSHDWEREILDLSPGSQTRAELLSAVRWEVSRRGTVDVMRRGITFGPFHLYLFYGAASSPGGSLAHFRQNRFSVIPRLEYSQDPLREPLDLCLFVNGLPVLTLTLARDTIQQTVADATAWYTRLPLSEEPLFHRGRCLAHLALDAEHAAYCADLRELGSVFLPFNRGERDDGPNPARLFGIPTEYVWQRILTRRSVADLIEHYARILSIRDEWSGRDRLAPIFPRYHQLEALRRVLADIESHGVGRRYLMHHGAGSGKTQSMVWLVSQLIDLEQVEMAMFGTVVVVTDRPASDPTLWEAIRQTAQMSAIMDARGADEARLEEYLESPHRIILVEVDDLPFVLHEIKEHFHGFGYAIVLDEIQPPLAAGKPPMEQRVNRAVSSRGSLPNASYFVFTALPDATTLELFGQPYNDRGVTRYRPFHQHDAS